MRVMKVKGTGRVETPPDIVRISLDVESVEQNYEECVRGLNMRTEKLREAMSAAGIERAELKTRSFRIDIKTEYINKRYAFWGYKGSHNLCVELPADKELLNRVLQQIAEGHSGAEVSISFSVKDTDALHKKVLARAVQDAKENARTLAEAAGLTLGEIVQMDYGWSEVRVYDRRMDMVCESGPAEYGPDIEPEDVSSQDSVTLVYELSG